MIKRHGRKKQKEKENSPVSCGLNMLSCLYKEREDKNITINNLDENEKHALRRIRNLVDRVASFPIYPIEYEFMRLLITTATMIRRAKNDSNNGQWQH